ncbi:MAG: holo-ACP synthase [Anaerolineales bacterium]|nr:holo-ACP synthase [Anaerolineales bacterium]
MSMFVVNGVDIVEIERIRAVLDRYGNKFLYRIYSSEEIDRYRDRIPSLAARFAAKEAVSKALGTGIGEVHWKDIEVLPGINNEPKLFLHSKAAELANELGVSSWSISLTHSNDNAIAIVVGIGMRS